MAIDRRHRSGERQFVRVSVAWIHKPFRFHLIGFQQLTNDALDDVAGKTFDKQIGWKNVIGLR